MEQSRGNFLNDEIDLRKLITTLFKHWVFLLILTLLGGLATGLVVFLRKPVYSATTYLSIDTSVIPFGVSATSFITGDDIQDAVAEKIGLPVEDLPEYVITSNKLDKTLHTITIESQNPILAVDTANIWADTVIGRISTNLNILKDELAQAKINADSASANLYGYLQDHGLGDLTWLDLFEITGLENGTGVVYIDPNRELPNISLKVKTELTQLVREVNTTDNSYQSISKSVLDETYALKYKAYVLNRALEAEKPELLQLLLLTIAGVFAGFIIGCTWVLVSDWWNKKT